MNTIVHFENQSTDRGRALCGESQVNLIVGDLTATASDVTCPNCAVFLNAIGLKTPLLEPKETGPVPPAGGASQQFGESETPPPAATAEPRIWHRWSDCFHRKATCGVVPEGDALTSGKVWMTDIDEHVTCPECRTCIAEPEPLL